MATRREKLREQAAATSEAAGSGWPKNSDDVNNNDDEADTFVDNKKEERRGNATRLVRIANRIESIEISRHRLGCCCRRLLKRYGSSEIPVESSSSVVLVSGLSPVVSGAAPASDTVRICSIRPPRYFFYAVSGFLCDIIQLFIDIVVHIVLGVNDPSLCWAIGFALSIVVRHSSHRYLAFGAYVGGYWRSLCRMYAGYSVIIALSTAFNHLMIRVAFMPHYVAFATTLLWTGLVNYFILKRLWSFDGKTPHSCKPNSSASKTVDKLDSTV
mmetsp:Transcript_32439/g.71604  ORF Transcript_32439/g.71604 Transcript_32439/m.71604 type:complete len:271 (-) Transcript_32439:3599-4411(-)